MRLLNGNILREGKKSQYKICFEQQSAYKEWHSLGKEIHIWKIERSNTALPPQTIALSAEARLIDTSTFLAATLQCWLRNILSTDSIIFRAKEDRSAMLHQHSNSSTGAECFYSFISNLASSTDLEQPLLSTCCWLHEESSNQGFARSWAALFPTGLAVSLQTASPCHPCVCEILSVLMCWLCGVFYSTVYFSGPFSC